VGGILLGGLVAYTVFVFYGFGPYPTDSPIPWWQPRGFLVDSVLLAPFGESPAGPIAAYTLPALLLAAGVWFASRSAVLRGVAVTCVLCSGLFLFYGLRFPGPMIWNFFGWRGSAVMICMAGVIAGALVSPWLAAAWLRRGWAVRTALYLPIALLVVAMATSATGTNPELRFNISPWPVVTVFGFGLLAPLIAGLLACVALGLAAWRVRSSGVALSVVGLVAAAVLPMAWIALRLPGGLWILGAALTASVLALALSARAVGNLTMGARSLAGYAATGAILVAIPLFAGRAWADLNYRATRQGSAQQIIDALAAYYEREGLYPEDLEELIEFGELEEIPRPRIGLPGLGDPEFSYQNLGSDYLLEFASPGWTQCHYSPPWDEELDEDYSFDEAEDDWGVAAPSGPVADEPQLGAAIAGLPAAEEDVVIPAPGELPLGAAVAGLPEADEDVQLGSLGARAAGLGEAEESIELGGGGAGHEAAGLGDADEVIDLDREDGPLPGVWSCPARPPELW
jgi:hypothetical protein